MTRPAPPARRRLRRLGAVAAAAAVAAGLLGARRRLAETADEPRALAALATWRPAAPARRLSRVFAYLWAAPVTLAGLVAAAAGGGGRIALRDGMLVVSGVGGLTGRALRLRGFTAITLGHVVLAREEPSPALLAHEAVHVRQAERLGPLIAPVYLGLMAVYGYRRHPMERAARLAQAEVGGHAHA